MHFDRSGSRRGEYSRHDGKHADDVHGERQAVHRLHRRNANGAGGIGGASFRKVETDALCGYFPAEGVATGNPIAFAGLSLNIISSSRSVNPRFFISAANAPTPAAPAYSFGA